MVLSLNKVAKSFAGAGGSVAIFRDVDLSLQAGQAVALTGESGCGKSTLLHLCAGLDQADAGTVSLMGRDLVRCSDRARAALRRDHLGLVFQQFNLIPSLSVADNLSFQARLAGRWDKTACHDLARRLGLEPHLGKFPEQLSGGQQQRLAIGRALAAKPAVILADEPTGNLDEATSEVVVDLLLELVSQSGAALLMVTHSEHLAARLPERRHLSGGRLR